MSDIQYTWTSKFIREISIKLRKSNSTQIWEHCMVLALNNKDEALNLYSLVKEELRR